MRQFVLQKRVLAVRSVMSFPQFSQFRMSYSFRLVVLLLWLKKLGVLLFSFYFLLQQLIAKPELQMAFPRYSVINFPYTY
ncbi:MAG: hypothetical protein OSA11_10910 [Candidatus Nanopelagicales bacterium]|nr:hypothetical protein [Candidatus Nanopelagicales bacterium]